MIEVSALAVSAVSPVADYGASVVHTDDAPITVHAAIDGHAVRLDRANLTVLPESRAAAAPHGNGPASSRLVPVGCGIPTVIHAAAIGCIIGPAAVIHGTTVVRIVHATAIIHTSAVVCITRATIIHPATGVGVRPTRPAIRCVATRSAIAHRVTA